MKHTFPPFLYLFVCVMVFKTLVTTIFQLYRGDSVFFYLDIFHCNKEKKDVDFLSKFLLFI